MEENFDVASPASSVISDTEANNQIIEEGPRICPLCSSEVRLFFINYHEKILMCENTECEFPFGYEELQFVRYVRRSNKDTDTDPSSQDEGSVSGQSQDKSEPSEDCSSLTGSDSSNSGSDPSDSDKITCFCESVNSQSDPKSLDDPQKQAMYKKRISKKPNEKHLKRTLEDLRGLTLELNKITKGNTKIKNRKWINHLMHLQSRSRSKLLVPLENKPKVNEEGASEMKIDIEPENGGWTSPLN